MYSEIFGDSVFFQHSSIAADKVSQQRIAKFILTAQVNCTYPTMTWFLTRK